MALVKTIQVPAGIAFLSINMTDEMMKQACGFTHDQISMLRAVYEDRYGVDPMTLTGDLISEVVKDFERNEVVATEALLS